MMEEANKIEQDFEREIEVICCLLDLAKQHKIDGSYESLLFIFAPMFNVLSALSATMYTYYQGVGSPGGASPEEMIAWLKDIAAKGGSCDE